MPWLVRFLIRHALIGFGLAVVVTVALVLFDVARLGTLMGHSPFGWLAVLVLAFSLGITFSSAQMGFAVMLLSDRDGPPHPRGGRRAPGVRPLLDLRPVSSRAGRPSGRDAQR